MLIQTTDLLPNNCTETIGLITASCCMCKSITGDMTANIRNWTIGGELKIYTNLIEDTTDIVIKRLIEKAISHNAKAIIGVRFSSTQVSEGAVELIIYGTAVK